MINFNKEIVTIYKYNFKIKKDNFYENIYIASYSNIDNEKDLWEFISNNVSGVRKDEDRLLFYQSAGDGILSFWFELPVFKDINDYQIEYEEAREFTKSLYEFIK